MASDDMQVQAAARRHNDVAAVCFVEKGESFYRVAGEVLVLLDRVNSWLGSLAEREQGIYVDLLKWTRHAEGGLTTQRLQDALLLVNAYLELFEAHRIKEVVVIAHPATLWEDSVLVETARATGLRMTVIGAWRFGTLKAAAYGFLRKAARPPFHLFGVIRTKLAEKSRVVSAPDREIVFQLCSSAERHVENITPIMKEIAARGYHPVALSWRAKGGAARVRQQGLAVVHLESYTSAGAVWKGLGLSRRTLGEAKARRAAFLADGALSHRGVPLGRALWPSIVHFLTAEVPLRYVLDSAVKRYVGEHRPVAIKLWGGGLLFEGACFVRNQPRGSEPVLMSWLWVTTPSPGPYESRFEHVDLLLAAGGTHKAYFARLGVPAEKIVSVGPATYDHLAAFAARHTPTDSRAQLGLPLGYSFHLLLDPNVVMRGYLSAAEQARTIEVVLNYARLNPSSAVLIKPHPSEDPRMLETRVAESQLGNVYLLNQRMLPFHAINAADVVVTKFSTVGLEAMLLRTPVISVILDGEARFRVFGEAAEYCFDTDKLSALLDRLAQDPGFNRVWTAARLNLQSQFVRSYRGENERPAAQLAADAIDMFIKRKKAAQKHERAVAGDRHQD